MVVDEVTWSEQARALKIADARERLKAGHWGRARSDGNNGHVWEQFEVDELSDEEVEAIVAAITRVHFAW